MLFLTRISVNIRVLSYDSCNTEISYMITRRFKHVHKSHEAYYAQQSKAAVTTASFCAVSHDYFIPMDESIDSEAN